MCFAPGIFATFLKKSAIKIFCLWMSLKLPSS